MPQFFTPLFTNLLPINHNEKRWLGNLTGCASSLLLSELSQHQQGLLVVVTKDVNQLNQLETELHFFGIHAHVFPDWETLPYDQLSPHQDIVSERIHLLTNMPSQGILLLTANTLMQRICPPSWLIGQHFDLKVGDSFDIEQQREQLTRAGYHAVDSVFEPGEFAVRGSLVDIFAMGQPYPIRLDLFDNEIETLRFFDPQTQRTLSEADRAEHNIPDKLSAFQILPAKEFPLVEGRETFRTNFAAQFPNVSSRKFELHQDVMNGVAIAGLDYYQPLFFDQDDWLKTGHVFSYLPKDVLFVLDEGLNDAFNQFYTTLTRRYNERCHDIDKPILLPEQLFFAKNQVEEKLNTYPRIMISQTTAPERAGSANVSCLPPPDLTIEHQKAQPLYKLLDFVTQQTCPVVLVAETAGRREILLDLLADKLSLKQHPDLLSCLINTTSNTDTANKPALALTIAPVERGLHLPDELIIISETQLFGRQVLQTRRRRKSDVSEEFLVKSISELTIGSPVVHLDHGIGRYNGLVTLNLDGEEQEFLQLKYADDASIYVPVANLQVISRYSGGDPTLAPLHKIGSEQWSKAKKKALEQIHDVAAELLNVQARRDAKAGIHFTVDAVNYDLFASQFAFEETPDQANAIEAVIFDMKQNKPMDRLVCGDVGFGKTEVAMRAAFIAVNAGYQVAVLVPTTLLAQQHLDNFKDRFADWAIRIEGLSRFVAKKTQDKTLEDLATGKVDIVIGTHKLLQDSIKFHNLGLMIIDEEHRFGVRHKERIKAMRTDVDMLTLTATPIPRTLNMSLSGMRDLSIIATPPARRLAVKTFVMQKTDAIFKEAILRELLRGGQVYVLHNDVASIERMAQNVRELVPEARVAVAHGQMRERELEAVMQAFYHKKYNVLVCSTIIETGIDVPNANTIIIERADKLGLAQLHQLRGRVGRSHHQAYAYLLVPSLKGLTVDAQKRLDAISRANTLGAGFMLASEDLEIRGAGEILGEEQSGNMQAIGFSLYMDMLNRATKAIKAGKQPDLETPLSLTSDINLHASALISDDYLPDVHQRLLFYKRISNADSKATLIHIRSEMIDRFGILPEPTKTLFSIHELRLLAEPLAITKIDINQQSGTIEFAQNTPVDARKIIKLIQSEPKKYRMDGAQKIKISDPKAFATIQGRLEVCRKHLEGFSE